MVTSGLIPGNRQKHVTAVSRRSALGKRKVSLELPSTLVFDTGDKEEEEKEEVEVLMSSVGSQPISSGKPNSSTSKGSDFKSAREASIKKTTDLVRMKHTSDENSCIL